MLNPEFEVAKQVGKNNACQQRPYPPFLLDPDEGYDKKSAEVKQEKINGGHHHLAKKNITPVDLGRCGYGGHIEKKRDQYPDQPGSKKNQDRAFNEEG